MIVKISQKGWVVIPVELRRKYALKPGTEVHVVDYGGVLSLIPSTEEPVDYAAGMLRGEKSLTKALLADRDRERARER